ncbi:MAG: hypothetical protein VKL41_03400 [Snowella sp.]|nr:hypothetical protein [Snowella sp.]
MQKTFHHILQLSQEEQNILAPYLQEHLNEFLKKPEKEKRIAKENYTINNFNEETQQAIRNIEKQKNLTICENTNYLYSELEI